MLKRPRSGDFRVQKEHGGAAEFFHPDSQLLGRANQIAATIPQVRNALERLSGRVSAADMRAMNYAADVEHRDVPVIVREFLTRTR